MPLVRALLRSLRESRPAVSGMRMSDTDRPPGNAGSGVRAGAYVGQVILLMWALGVFYHFYRSQGFFELVGQIVEQGP